MATIGTFASTGNGFTGSIKTLNLNVKAKLVRVENPSDICASAASCGHPCIRRFAITRPATIAISRPVGRAASPH